MGDRSRGRLGTASIDALGGTVSAATSAIASSVRVQSERLAERVDAAHRALAHLRALERMPLLHRDAIDSAVGDVARTLAHVRRSLRALGAELSALESEGRELVGRVFERRARHRDGAGGRLG